MSGLPRILSSGHHRQDLAPASEEHAIEDRSEPEPVIVGVDGSGSSAEALTLADLLASALGRRMLIGYVHPYGRLSSPFSEEGYAGLVRQVAEPILDEVREQLPSTLQRRLVLVSERSPAAGLDAIAEHDGAALIVIGSSHRSKVGRILVGGTGQRLLSGASAPVAVAPAGYAAPDRGIQVVGCGFDGSRESHRALAWAAQLARRLSARLRVLSVYERTLPASLAAGGGLATASINDVLRRELEEELARTLSALHPDIDVSDTLMDGDAEELLSRESGELDLLVVGSRGYGPLRAVLLGSVSSGLVHSAQSPLVVIPRGAAGDVAAQGSTRPRRIA